MRQPPVISNVDSMMTDAKNVSLSITREMDDAAPSDVFIAGSRYTDASLVTSHGRNFQAPKARRSSIR